MSGKFKIMGKELNQQDELLCKKCGNQTKVMNYKITINRQYLICFECAAFIKIEK
jgi:hypothetical protein